MVDVTITSNQEPRLSNAQAPRSTDSQEPISGLEPSLGGNKRPKLNRDLFWRLLDIDRYTRMRAIEQVLEQGMAKYYGSAMIVVLQPNARHHQLGRLLKIPYSYERKLAAIDSLAQLKPDSALHGLLVAMTNKDIALQQAATFVIGQLDDPNADDVLVDIARDPRPKLRHAALQSLAVRWQQPNIRYLNHSLGHIVAASGEWLGRYDGLRILPLLIAAFYYARSDSDQAQLGLLDGISALCQRFRSQLEQQTTAFLQECLESRLTDAVKRRALQALEEIGTQQALAIYIVYQNYFPNTS